MKGYYSLEQALKKKARKLEIYLVGAGPGSAELLTQQAASLISRADSILYDHLISDEVLALAPKGARLLYSGKRSGTKHKEQESINMALLAEAKRLSAPMDMDAVDTDGRPKKKILLRLKGGDPLLFSHAEAEMEFLHLWGYRVRVAPGISSYQAAAAAARLPLTRRGKARSLTILTGKFAETKTKKLSKKKNDRLSVSAEKNEEAPSSLGENSSSLIAAAATLVYVMGIKNLARLVENLLEVGKPLDTPVLAVERVALPNQKIHYTSLGKLRSYHKSSPIKNPAVLFIGKAAAHSFAQNVSWLDGLHVGLLGRKRAYASLSGLLTAEGATVVEIPLFHMKRLRLRAGHMKKLLKKGAFKTLLFSSARAVDFFFAALFADGLDVRALAGMLTTVAIAPGTAQAMGKHGLKADFIASKRAGSQEALVSLLKKERLNHILIPRATEARSVLEDFLQAEACSFHVLPLYEKKNLFCKDSKKNPTLAPHDSDILKETTESWEKNLISFDRRSLQERMKQVDVLLFCSPKESEVACQFVARYNMKLPPSISIGKPSFENLRKWYLERGLAMPPGHQMAAEPSFSALLQALLDTWGKKTDGYE